MIDEVLEQSIQKKQPTIQKTVVSVKRNTAFIPSRFSVRKLRKHPGIIASRNPTVVG